MQAQIDLSNDLQIAKVFFHVEDTTNLKTWLGNDWVSEIDTQVICGACTLDVQVTRLKIRYPSMGISFIFANPNESTDKKSFLWYIDLDEVFTGLLPDGYQPGQSIFKTILSSGQSYHWSDIDCFKKGDTEYALFLENAILYLGKRISSFHQVNHKKKYNLDELFSSKKIGKTRLTRPQIHYSLFLKYQPNGKLMEGEFEQWEIKEGENYVFSIHEETGELETYAISFEIPMGTEMIEVDTEDMTYWEEHKLFYYAHRKGQTIQSGRLTSAQIKGSLTEGVWQIELTLPINTDSSFLPQKIEKVFTLLE